MPVFAILTIIVLIMEISGQPIQYVVTSTPNWNHIYTGGSVTLTCDIGPNENINNHYIYWYKDNKMIKEVHEFTIRKAKHSDAGDYECRSGSGVRSHVFTLYVADKGYIKASVTFSPNYRNIIVGDEMTISCESEPSRNQKYVWYKDGEQLQKKQEKVLKIVWAGHEDSGKYACGIWNRYYTVKLDVSGDTNIILQTPHNILEGDSVDLKCHSDPDYMADEKTTVFYKDGVIIHKSKEILHLASATKSTSGIYRCKKKTQDGDVLQAEDMFVYIQDLFTSPEIKAPYNIKEGDDSTVMTCDTRRNPLREDTELLFAFYRNGQEVQEFSLSNRYRIQSTQLKDSGNYTCEVRSVLGTVMKMSDVLPIRITELFMKPKLQIHQQKVREGDKVMMKCQASFRLYNQLFKFYRDSQTLESSSYNDQYVISQASGEHTGTYTCSLTYKGISKNSTGLILLVQIAVNKPTLMLLPNEVALGDDTILRCESSKGSLPIYYLFYHNETLLGNITIHQREAAELRLTVRSLAIGGLYYCVSYNDFQTQHQQSAVDNLLVVEPVADINITADKESEGYVLGQSLTFTCFVQRGTSISIFWQHNETSVENDSEFYQLQDNGKVLSIDSIQHHHEGTYRCCAKNKVSVSRTFSVCSESRSVNIWNLNAASLTTYHSIQWVVRGIVLLVIILAIGLMLTYREKIVSVGRCHKKQSSTEVSKQQNTEDVSRQNATRQTEGVYENIPTREDLDDGDEGCTYINIKAVQAPFSYPAGATRDDQRVTYSTVKCVKVTSNTKTDEKTAETSNSTDIYHTITAVDLNYHQ